MVMRPCAIFFVEVNTSQQALKRLLTPAGQLQVFASSKNSVASAGGEPVRSRRRRRRQRQRRRRRRRRRRKRRRLNPLDFF
jgi:hypothetical protein